MVNQQAIHWDNLESINIIIDQVGKKKILISNNSFEIVI